MLGELARPVVSAGVTLKRKFSSGRETAREWNIPWKGPCGNTITGLVKK